jgi:glycosyltransferase involved in cell wall biosynthesis
MTLVSIITPSFNRQKYLPLLAQSVAGQSYKNIEWLIFDDSPEKMQNVPGQTHYFHSDSRISIGQKRNYLAEKARGEIIVHFDDDDYYGPEYIQGIIEFFGKEPVDHLLLSGFLVADLNSHAFGWYVPQIKAGPAFVFTPNGTQLINLSDLKLPFVHLCYGFGYAYRKAVWQAVNFPDRDGFEDREFTKQVLQQFQVKARADENFSVIHTVHGQSTSNCFPQFMIPDFVVHKINPNAGQHLQALRDIFNNK